MVWSELMIVGSTFLRWVASALVRILLVGSKESNGTPVLKFGTISFFKN